jgi:hypothetical protein
MLLRGYSPVIPQAFTPLFAFRLRGESFTKRTYLKGRFIFLIILFFKKCFLIILFFKKYNELQKNIIKSLYDGISNFTINQRRRVFAELLADECKAIMNYEFNVNNREIKIFSKHRIGVNPRYDNINVEYIFDFEP